MSFKNFLLREDTNEVLKTKHGYSIEPITKLTNFNQHLDCNWVFCNPEEAKANWDKMTTGGYNFCILHAKSGQKYLCYATDSQSIGCLNQEGDQLSQYTLEKIFPKLEFELKQHNLLESRTPYHNGAHVYELDNKKVFDDMIPSDMNFITYKEVEEMTEKGCNVYLVLASPATIDPLSAMIIIRDNQNRLFGYNSLGKEIDDPLRALALLGLRNHPF